MNLFQVFTTGFDLLTDYRHETGHINLLPDPEPFIGKCLGIRYCRTPRPWVSGSGTGPRDTSFVKSITCHCQVSENINNNLKLVLANNLMKCESLGITSGTLKYQYSHVMSLNKLVNLPAEANFRRKFRVDLLPFLNVTLSIKRMFSNKPQLGLP